MIRYLLLWIFLFLITLFVWRFFVKEKLHSVFSKTIMSIFFLVVAFFSLFNVSNYVLDISLKDTKEINDYFYEFDEPFISSMGNRNGNGTVFLKKHYIKPKNDSSNLKLKVSNTINYGEHDTYRIVYYPRTKHVKFIYEGDTDKIIYFWK